MTFSDISRKKRKICINGFSCRNAYAALIYLPAFKYACTYVNALVKTKLGKQDQLIALFRHRAQQKFISRKFGRRQVNGQVQITMGEGIEKTKYIKPRMKQLQETFFTPCRTIKIYSVREICSPLHDHNGSFLSANISFKVS